MKRCHVHVHNLLSSTRCALGVLVAAILAGDVHASQASGGAFKNQIRIDRSPEDVALHPFVPHPSGGTGGGVAVVRASQRDLTGGLLPASFDDIVVIKTLNGDRAPLTGYNQGMRMTAAFGASDLVDVGINISCSVLIGQRHDGSDPSSFRSFLDVVDLNNAYGPSGASCTLRWTSDPGFGFVNDVEIHEALCFAVVNHKNEARVVDLLNATTFNIGIPLTSDPAVVFADPTYQRNSVAVTRSTGATATHRAVVTTCRRFLTDPQLYPVFQVSVLDLTATSASEELRWSPDPAIAAHEPFDVAITPNDQMAVVIANDAVALFDLTSVPPDNIGVDITTNGVVRDYADLSDAMVLTDTYVVTLGAINDGADWQADVYAISTTAPTPLNKVHSITGTGQPHDIERSADGKVVVIRTTEDVVVLKNLLSPTLLRTDVPSPSAVLTRDGNGVQYDSIAISRKWAEQSSGGGPGVVRHYAVALGKVPGTPAGPARVDVIDITFGPKLVKSWQLDSITAVPVVPASLRMLPGGQMVSICAAGEPHDLDPNDPNTPVLDGTDAWVFDLRASPVDGLPIGQVFHCERQGWPQVNSDPMESISLRSVSLSRNLLLEEGYIHTIEIIDP